MLSLSFLGGVVVNGLLVSDTLKVDVAVNIPSRNAEPLGSLCYRHTMACYFYHAGPTRVTKIGRSADPSTVAGSVGAIVVNTVKVHPWRAFTHVSEKHCEVVPARVYCNAASAVVVV